MTGRVAERAAGWTTRDADKASTLYNPIFDFRLSTFEQQTIPPLPLIARRLLSLRLPDLGSGGGTKPLSATRYLRYITLSNNGKLPRSELSRR